jgi:hypothetical protein
VLGSKTRFQGGDTLLVPEFNRGNDTFRFRAGVRQTGPVETTNGITRAQEVERDRS